MQQDITDFESQFNGTYPFTSAGVLVGVPSASFEEEMETMITFAGGRIDARARSTTRTCTSGGVTTSARATTT